MTVTGCAGFETGVPDPRNLLRFDTVFVGARRTGPAGDLCAQTLSNRDGSFSLPLSDCFDEGETVFFTSDELDTCVAVPFRSRTHTRVDLFGGRAPCP